MIARMPDPSLEQDSRVWGTKVTYLSLPVSLMLKKWKYCLTFVKKLGSKKFWFKKSKLVLGF